MGSQRVRHDWGTDLIWKEINPEYSLEGLMLKLKLQYFVKNQVIGKDTDAGKDWGQKENRVAEDEMVGWHHQLNGLEFQQTQIWAKFSNEFEQKIMEDRGAWCAAISGVMTSYWTATATTLSKKPCGLPTAGKRNLRKKAEVGVKVSSFSLTTVKQTLICITKLVLMKLRTFVQVPCHSLVMGKTCVKP